MKKILLIVALWLSIATAWAQTATMPSGSGTSSSPYLIATVNNLYWLSQNSSYWASTKYFKQTADISLSGITNWTPIGNDGTRFNGVYDGNNFTISAMAINRSSNDQGLFGSTGTAFQVKDLSMRSCLIQGNPGYVGTVVGVNRGTVSNCKVYDGYVKGSSYVGGVVGLMVDNTSATISNCYNNSNVYGTGDMTGGIVGRVLTGTVYRCTNAGTLSSTGRTLGGVVGELVSSTVSECANIASITSTVSGVADCGGVVGVAYNESSRATIINCYNIKNVTASGASAGGVVGSAKGSNVSYCYNAGTVSAGSQGGGVAGYCETYNTFTSCVSSGSVLLGQGSPTLSNTALKTTTELKQFATFTGIGFNFSTIWCIASNKNNGYPMFLKDGVLLAPEISIGSVSQASSTSFLMEGSITYLGEPNPTSYGFCWSSTNVLPTTADSKSDMGVINGNGFAPYLFAGTITGLTAEKLYYVRAYATNKNGTVYSSVKKIVIMAGGNPYLIKNLDQLVFLSENSNYWSYNYEQTTDIDAAATSTMNSGSGFSPIGNSTTKFTGSYNGRKNKINNLYVNRPLEFEGGLFGRIEGGSVSNLELSNPDIYAHNYSGGICGYLVGDMSGCCVTGAKVLSKSNSGGLVGYLSGNITNCYSTGVITGTNSAGGIAGNFGNGEITKCYSIAEVGGGSYYGSITGNSTGIVTSSFYDISHNTNTNTGQGITAAELKSFKYYNAASWDFNTVWAIAPGVNNGYPCFLWQVASCKPIISVTISDIAFTTATATLKFTACYPCPYKIEILMSKVNTTPTSSEVAYTLDGTGNFNDISTALSNLDVNTTYYVSYNVLMPKGLSTNSSVVSFKTKNLTPTAGILYVTEHGAGDKTGSSWANALNGAEYTPDGQSFLKYALDNVPEGTQIWVAGGTYTPHKTDYLSSSFVLKNNIKLYGGFAGNETSIEGRDLANVNNKSTLSGALSNGSRAIYLLSFNNTAESLADGFTFIGASNAIEVKTNSLANISNCVMDANRIYNDGTTKLNGCTISNSKDGGIYSNNGNLDVRNCIFSGNSADFGGAIYVSGGSIYAENCVFKNNHANAKGGAYYDVAQNGSQLINCTFYNNTAPYPNGAAVYSKGVNIFNSIFWNPNGGYGSDFSGDGSSNILYCAVRDGNLDTNTASPFVSETDLSINQASANGLLCINAGNDKIKLPLTDLAGNTRVVGKLVDLGAYEVQCVSPVITTNIADKTVHVGDAVEFTVEATYAASYQWYINDEDLITGATTNKLTFSKVALTDANKYNCVITSDCGGQTKSVLAVLTVDTSVGIITADSGNSISIYPNPANSRINIKGVEGMVNIYDLNGRLVLAQQPTKEMVNIESLAKGVYVVKAGVMKVKLVKE